MPTTHVLMVTDMSGSMAPSVAAVRSGFNEYVANLPRDREGEMKFRVTAWTFNTEAKCIASHAKPEEVPMMDHHNYNPAELTALIDAVWSALDDLQDTVTLEKDDKVLVFIQTDGAENASRLHTQPELARRIAELTADGQWGFLYVGSGVESWQQGYGLGVPVVRSSDRSSQWYRFSYGTMREATARYAGGQTTNSVADFMEAENVGAGMLTPDPEPPSPDPGSPGPAGN